MSDRPHSIIIVEDNVAVREALCDHLVFEGFEVRGVDDGEALTTALALRRADALVLDLNLPFEDGISIAARVRRACPDIGILILSGRVLPRDRADGYTSGADVYLTKPASPDELTTVLRNLCRRLLPKRLAPEWLLDPAQLALTCPQGRRSVLSVSESALLQALALAGGLLSLSRLCALFGDPDMDEDANKVRIEKLISRVRQKLAPLLDDQPSIKAVHRQGYKLFVPIRVVPSSVASVHQKTHR